MKKLSIFILVLSFIAVFLGATFKLDGNPNSTILLNAGVVTFVAGMLLLMSQVIRKDKLKK